jgi:acyl-CoA thioesterase I
MLRAFGISIALIGTIIGARLLLLLKDISDFKVYWETTARQKPPENSLLYIALGDSAAQGIGASKPTKGYVGLVAQELEKKYGRPVHIINISVSGATVDSVTENQIPKLRDIPDIDKAIITLDIGANDVNRNLKDEAAFENDLDTLLALLPKQTVVADLPSFARTRFWMAENRIQGYNPILRKVAQKYGLKVAPLHDMTAADTSLLANSTDIFHPSDRGYRNWAKAFIGAL